MKSSERLKAHIRECEGFSKESYRKSDCIWTCGFGHTFGVSKDTTCTREQAEAWLLQDLAAAEYVVNNLSAAVGGLRQGQYDAIVDFVFNVGAKRFAISTLKKVITTDKESQKVGEELRRWVFCKGVRLKGLVNRREWESRTYYEK